MFGSRNNNIKSGLRIIIIGCGKVGTTLIEQLRNEGHDITIIDKNAALVSDLIGTYDIMGIAGNGASYSVQIEAGIEQTDLLIALTDSDELNLLCCTIAKQVAGCAAIARVRNPEYSAESGYLREKLGLAMIINPELEAANEAARLLYLPTALEVNTFSNGQAEMIKLRLPKNHFMDGKTIADVSKMIPVKFLICAVERDGEVYIPSGDFILHASDAISFSTSKKNEKELLKKIGFPTQQVKNTIIIGGGKAAFYLANQLIPMGIEVKIIEANKARCEELSCLLPKAIIINGDGSDEELLKEEGIIDAQSFVPLTGIDEENIMLTLHVKHISNAKTITKINRITFKDVINYLDLDSVIYPKYITSEAIIAYVRAKQNSKNSNIETLYHLFDFKAEAIEFVVDESCVFTNRQLMDITTKDNLLIAAINRDGDIIIPNGTDTIKTGDSIIVFTKHTGLNDINEILA